MNVFNARVLLNAFKHNTGKMYTYVPYPEPLKGFLLTRTTEETLSNMKINAIRNNAKK